MSLKHETVVALIKAGRKDLAEAFATEASRVTAADGGIDFTIGHLEKAKGSLWMGDATSSLDQVARYSEIPDAQAFAKTMEGNLRAYSKKISEYLHNNRDLTRKPPKIARASCVTAAAKDSFAYYLDTAQVQFFEAVAKDVNRWAKSKGKATVKRGNAAVWFEYAGVDSSDLDVELRANMVTKDDYNVMLWVNVNSAYTGQNENKYTYKTGAMTVGVVADLIVNSLGG